MRKSDVIEMWALVINGLPMNLKPEDAEELKRRMLAYNDDKKKATKESKGDK